MLWQARDWLQESSVACFRYLQQLLFHVSFLVLGPLIWLLSLRCPPEVPELIYFSLATLWPVFCSCRGLLRHHNEKEEKAEEKAREDEEAQKTRKWWQFKLKLVGLKEEFRMSSELEEEMCFWLSYWSCWPILGAIQVSVGHPDRPISSWVEWNSHSFDLVASILEGLFRRALRFHHVDLPL